MMYELLKNHDNTVLMRLYDLEDNYKTGIINHFHSYINRVSPNSIIERAGNLCVPVGLITTDYINTYLIKENRVDFSSKDCAYLAINRVGIPPEEEMSVESMERFIRTLFNSNDYKKVVYGKHIKGKKNVTCVDWETANKIINSPDVREYIGKQIAKAEKRDKHKDEVAWRAYELEKKKIEYLDSLNSSEDYSDCYTPFVLSKDARTNLMVEAIYNLFYTDFDFEKYESYREEMLLLDADWDFGKRYQDLEDIFSAPDFKGVFYKLKPENAFLDALADKIAEKIIEKSSGNGSKE